MKQAFLRSALVGTVFSAGCLAVLGHGLLGAGSLFTGAVIVAPLLGLFVLGDWRGFRPNLCDALFCAFALFAAASIALRGSAGGWKEAILLAASIAAYPAGRLSGDLPLRRGIYAVAGTAIILGTIATVPALLEQWSARHGKPLVFGEFDAAPTQFAMLLGLLVLTAVTSSKAIGRHLSWAGPLLGVAVAIYSASMVRFTFLALVAALAAVHFVDDNAASKRTIRVVIGIVICGVLVGNVARWKTSSVYLTHVATIIHIKPLRGDERLVFPDPADAHRCRPIEADNSIAIRAQLLVDAVRMVPEAGPFGIGFDRFGEEGCVKGLSPHNSFLQATVELGWGAGAALLLLLLTTIGGSSIAMARISPRFRFAGAALIYAVLLASAHGRLNGEYTLFLLLGYAAALRSSKMEIAKRWMLDDVEVPAAGAPRSCELTHAPGFGPRFPG